MKNVSPNHNTKNHRHLQKISTNAIEKFSLQQSNNFFDRGYLLWKHQLRSRQRNIIKVLTCASLLGSGGYTTSPQLSPLLFQNIHQTSYHIADTLNAYGFRPGDTIYQSNDQETNIIMDIMAGYGNNPAFNQMLHTYKYDTLIPIDKFCHKDPALYKALRKIYEKYGNPHLTIGASAKDYMTGETFPERGFLHPIQNQIRMYDITEKKINFGDPTSGYYEKIYKVGHINLPKPSADDRQRKLIKTFFNELPHAYQLKRDGAIKLITNAISDEIKAIRIDSIIHRNKQNTTNISKLGSIHNHDALYTTPGTYEHEAHNVLEPEITKEFIDLYTSLADTTDPMIQYKIGIFYNGYFAKYQDGEEAEKRLIKAANSTNKQTHQNNKYATFLLGNRYLMKMLEMDDKIDSLHATKDFTKYISYINKRYEYETLAKRYYQKSASAGALGAIRPLVNICIDNQSPENIVIGAKRGAMLMENWRILATDDTVYSSVDYMNYSLWIAYFYGKIGNKEKYNYHFNKGIEESYCVFPTPDEQMHRQNKLTHITNANPEKGDIP